MENIISSVFVALSATTVKVIMLIVGYKIIKISYKLFLKGIEEPCDLQTKWMAFGLVINKASPGVVMAVLGTTIIGCGIFKEVRFSIPQAPQKNNSTVQSISIGSKDEIKYPFDLYSDFDKYQDNNNAYSAEIAHGNKHMDEKLFNKDFDDLVYDNGEIEENSNTKID